MEETYKYSIDGEEETFHEIPGKAKRHKLMLDGKEKEEEVGQGKTQMRQMADATNRC